MRRPRQPRRRIGGARQRKRRARLAEGRARPPRRCQLARLRAGLLQQGANATGMWAHVLCIYFAKNVMHAWQVFYLAVSCWVLQPEMHILHLQHVSETAVGPAGPPDSGVWNATHVY